MTVTRNGNGLGEVSVNYETVDGTAKADEDYIATTGILEWATGDNYSQTVAIPIIFAKIAAFSGSFINFSGSISSDFAISDNIECHLTNGAKF